jgi:hypothetical protein
MQYDTQGIRRHFRRHPRQESPACVGSRVCEPDARTHVRQGGFNHLAHRAPLPLGTRGLGRHRPDLRSIGRGPMGKPVRPAAPTVRHDGLVGGVAITVPRAIHLVGSVTWGWCVSEWSGPRNCGTPAWALHGNSASQRSCPWPEASARPWQHRSG